MSRKRARSSTPPASEDLIHRSSPIEDRDSTFIGLYSPSLSAKTLQATEDISSASHRISAWRKPSAQRTIGASSQPLFDMGYDDDGEKWAGKKLETVLASMKVEGAVVVARWYGGVMLGPVRFTHIENCAKEAVKVWQDSEIATRNKSKLEEMERHDKIRLEAILKERDQSIHVLRSLLTEKRLAKTDITSAAPIPQNKAPARPVDYSRMTLEALKRLEKAKDATLAFVLAELDKFDAERDSID